MKTLNIYIIALTILTVLFPAKFISQTVQTIRGTVLDASTNSPVSFANVKLLNTDPVIGTNCDSSGFFEILNVPIGRYDILVTSVGYEKKIIREVQLSSGKAVNLPVQLVESLTETGDITVNAELRKEMPINKMSTVSARMLSVEEANRYAGGFDDPARLASSFSGVSSSTANNSMIVRGNAPKFFQWKMEGIEIPNPNHFADLSFFGGGGLTALSSQMLANSDFFTGAFPSEYGNSLSGVFDIFMRTGNNKDYEHTMQAGLIGIDFSSEGPFKRGSKSSYLFNYRYSTLALLSPLLPENGGGVRYQDLAFKFNFPTLNAGIFSIWGIGLVDHSGQEPENDPAKWFYEIDKQEQSIDQYMGASGITHRFLAGRNFYIQTSLAATVNGIRFSINELDLQNRLLPLNNIKNHDWNYVFTSFASVKFNANHTNKTGIAVTGLRYEMELNNAGSVGEPLRSIVDEKGFSTLVSAYTNSSIRLEKNWLLNIGLHSQFFSLNNHYVIEPRIGIKWSFKNGQSLALAYGLHSRLERLNYYFIKNIAHNNEPVNRNLDFTKAHHVILAYDISITENLFLKTELYYQSLFNVPVIKDSSFSFINLINDWFFNEKLENTGKGRNYGLEITFEKYLTKGYYFLATFSLFNSEYHGGDNIWRNTRFNKNYLFNFLVGKEWQTGSKNQNVLGLNVRMTYQGGDRYSPVNLSESIRLKEVIYDENRAFEEQIRPSFNAHFTASYKINSKKITHEISLKVINITMQNDFYGFNYNYINGTVDEHLDAIIIPNISYKLEF